MQDLITEPRIAQVLDAVYDAALDPQGWDAALERLAVVFHCHFADLFSRSHDRSRYAGQAHGLDRADYQDLFLDTWFKRNVWGLSRPVKIEGEVMSTREMLDPAVLVRSEIYTDYLGPRGLHEGLRLSLRADQEGIQDISLLRTWSAGPFTTSEYDVAGKLLPHLQRAAAVSRRLAQAEAAASAGMMGLSAAGLAALVLDGTGRPTLLNAAAERVIGVRDGLLLQAGELRAATGAATSALRKAIGRALDGPLRRSAMLRLPRLCEADALTVVILPLGEAARAGLAERGGALMLFSDPLARGPSPMQLSALFALTEAEADLACDLLAGLDLRAIAARRGRSIHTLRNHLANLMGKTGTSRQAELTRLLRGIPADPDS